MKRILWDRDLTILMEIVRSLFGSGAFVPGEVVCLQISSRGALSGNAWDDYNGTK